MNNQLGIMFQMMKGGVNPKQIIGNMMNNNQVMQNPMAQNAMKMFQNGDMQGLQNMAENLAKERGTTVNEVKNSIMQQFGMK